MPKTKPGPIQETGHPAPSQYTDLIADQITGLYETHVPVADLTRAQRFYQDTLGLALARELPARKVAFYWVGNPQEAMLGLWETGSAPLGMRLHFAFRMQAKAILQLPRRLDSSGIQPLGFHGEPVREPIVIGWMPALSLYCQDPDGHSVEFICKLTDAPDPEFGIGPCSDWQARQAEAAKAGPADP